MHIIMLSGWKRSGKNTVADYLERRHGYIQLSLAEPLKDLVAEKYRIPRFHLDNQDLKEKPISKLPYVYSSVGSLLREEMAPHPGSGELYWTPRALCILEGATLRAVDPHYWTKDMIRRMETSGETLFVVSDVRYRDEVNYIRMEFPQARLIRITREETSPSLDPSERDLDNHTWDAEIHNTGSMADLEHMVDITLADLEKSRGRSRW